MRVREQEERPFDDLGAGAPQPTPRKTRNDANQAIAPVQCTSKIKTLLLFSSRRPEQAKSVSLSNGV
jgi:hypothetical protein